MLPVVVYQMKNTARMSVRAAFIHCLHLCDVVRDRCCGCRNWCFKTCTAILQAARPEMEVLMKWLKERQSMAGDKVSLQQILSSDGVARFAYVPVKHDH